MGLFRDCPDRGRFGEGRHRAEQRTSCWGSAGEADTTTASSLAMDGPEDGVAVDRRAYFQKPRPRCFNHSGDRNTTPTLFAVGSGLGNLGSDLASELGARRTWDKLADVRAGSEIETPSRRSKEDTGTLQTFRGDLAFLDQGLGCRRWSFFFLGDACLEKSKGDVPDWALSCFGDTRGGRWGVCRKDVERRMTVLIESRLWYLLSGGPRLRVEFQEVFVSKFEAALLQLWAFQRMQLALILLHR